MKLKKEIKSLNKKTRKDIVLFIEEYYPDEDHSILLADGFEEAFIGVVESMGLNPKACYSYSKCIEILSNEMNHEEAIEYFEFNVAGSYVGEYTPAFLKEDEFFK